eukprot:364474-Chlamydomonas_euryale.AAC.6
MKRSRRATRDILRPHSPAQEDPDEHCSPADPKPKPIVATASPLAAARHCVRGPEPPSPSFSSVRGHHT